MFPTQFKIDNITIGETDIMGLYSSIELYENIFIPLVTGSIYFVDADSSGFVDENKIEFNENFKFTIVNARDERMNFVGVLNGLAGIQTKGNKKHYKVDFVSKEMRENDQIFVSKKLKGTPVDLMQEMIEEIKGEIDEVSSPGKQMEFNAGRWKPLHVVKYILSRGVSDNAKATNKEKQREEKAQGTSGFLCWQVIGDGSNKYRITTVDKLIKGAFGTHETFNFELGMRGGDNEEDMQKIVEYDFNEMGDIQTKMKSGAFRSTVVSFDMDTGLYKEYEFDGSEEENLMTDKQKEIVKKPTRIMCKPYSNDLFGKGCQKEADNTGDQSREYLAQGISRQNTFNDQTGYVTLYPQFKIHAGDLIQLKINKVLTGDTKGNSENEKHSGKYVVKQIGHHFSADGRAYSKITTIRSSIQADKQTASKG